MTFKWTKEMRIDDGQIDADHKKLISIANRILTLEQPGKNAEVLKQLIRELYDYVVYHFAREEDLMKKLEYHIMGEDKKLQKFMDAKVDAFLKKD